MGFTRQADRATPFQGALVAYYLDALNTEGPAVLENYQFGSNRVKIAKVNLGSNSSHEFWFYGTLGFNEAIETSDTQVAHEFIAITDGKSSAACECIAAAVHYNHIVSLLSPGETVPLGQQSSLRGRGYSTGLVLNASVYLPFPDSGAGFSLPLHLLTIFPITEIELQLKHRHGVSAVLDAWKDEGRSILSYPGDIPPHRK